MNGLKITNLIQGTLLGPAFKLLKGTCSNYAELEYDFEECYKDLSEKLDWNNPKGGDYPFDLTLVMNGNHQIVLVDYFFNNNLKYLQGGIPTMTYTTSITKTKAAQYDLPGIEDMVPNIWSPVKVAYDKHALWGISHWRDQRKTFYGYARGVESSHDVYSTKRILAVTRVEVMRKHGYGYLREIGVRRADNDLYTFKEGDFPRLRINDIEDMLIRVEDLQLGVESYQKKINFTKLETTRLGIKKKNKTLKDSFTLTPKGETGKWGFQPERLARVWLVTTINSRHFNPRSGVGVDTAYPRHGYAVSSLMDTTYWLSK
ncbi:hypothetical protein Tco_0438015 [Tanacetum coccineum]